MKHYSFYLSQKMAKWQLTLFLQVKMEILSKYSEYKKSYFVILS